MDLNEIIESVETSDKEVEFKPAGKSTGWVWTLRHESAPEVQAVLKTFNAKIRQAMMRRKNTMAEKQSEEHADNLRIAHVVTWRWEATKDGSERNFQPEFSKKELRKLLDHEKFGYFVRQFIDDETGTLEDFLERSESGSVIA